MGREMVTFVAAFAGCSVSERDVGHVGKNDDEQETAKDPERRPERPELEEQQRHGGEKGQAVDEASGPQVEAARR